MTDLSVKVIVLVSADAEWLALQAIFTEMVEQPSPFGAWFITRVSVTPENLQNESGLKGIQVRSEEDSYPVMFFHGGWGKIAAAASTQYVIDRWQPALLINLGTCGGFEGQIEQGEVILATKTIVYDIIELMGDFDEHIAHYSTVLDPGWLDVKALPFQVRETLLVSGDRDLLVSEIPELNTRYGAVAGDWESGAIAWVAGRNQTRLLIFRGVSDVVREAGSDAYGNLEYFVASTERIMRQLVGALPTCLAQARQRLKDFL